MMTYEDQVAQIEAWLEPYTSHYGAGFGRTEVYRIEPNDGAGARLVLATATHHYSISFGETYLGCIAHSRVTRPGEKWLRGNDLPDGPFTEDTFNAIMRSIVGYELVSLDPLPEFRAAVSAEPNDGPTTTYAPPPVTLS